MLSPINILFTNMYLQKSVTIIIHLFSQQKQTDFFVSDIKISAHWIQSKIHPGFLQLRGFARTPLGLNYLLDGENLYR